jgi:hypothetical protein
MLTPDGRRNRRKPPEGNRRVFSGHPDFRAGKNAQSRYKRRG